VQAAYAHADHLSYFASSNGSSASGKDADTSPDSKWRRYFQSELRESVYLPGERGVHSARMEVLAHFCPGVQAGHGGVHGMPIELPTR
jgi:hypothetical protein